MSQPDTVLGGRYKLDEVIGRGGMAEVWRAQDLRLGREVAVKRLRVDLATDPTFQARFRREAQSAAGLNHPNIVSTYDTGEEPDAQTGIAVPFIVMELVEGHTLRDLLRADRPIRAEKAFEWTQGVLDALGQSHKAGIIHRDIKPANVMLTPTGQVKVMDFGIARAVADTSATMTQTAAVIGTAQYLSPEQARGETVDSRSDIYSAGCLLYELLCGRPPFVGDSPVSVAYQHVREAPVPPSTLDPSLTPAMDAIVLKSLAKSPAERYQTAREMRDDIARMLAGQPVLATLPTTETFEQSVNPTAVTTLVPSSANTPSAPTSAAAPATGTNLFGDEEALEEEPKKSRVGWIIALLLAALLALGGISAYVFLRPSGDGDMAVVPSVMGQNEQAATAELTAAGFQVASEHANGPEDTVKQVIDQAPDAAQKAERGSTVTITINDGPQTSKIPTNIVGMTVDEAKKALVEAGFTKANISTEDATWDQEKEHSDFTKGQVVTSNPAPGGEVSPSAKITLYRATGKVQVPDLTDKSLEDATKVLKDLGLEVSSTEEQVTTPGQDGRIIGQKPGANEAMERGRTVGVVVGRYTAPQPTITETASETPSATPTEQKTVPVPDVVGQPADQARTALETQGFAVGISEAQISDPAMNGLVVDQDPRSGELPLGGTINLGVGKYTEEASQPATPQPSTAPTAKKTP